ncbi:MAG: serine dehydratase subunit alpha family protein [Bacteroidales bacterium]|nr:serine dehydratase subunit alpha family protein [Bacteroidales bacterium]
MTTRESEIIELIHKEVKPALGCTEPIAVALASAKAAEELPGSGNDGLTAIEVEVSGNILKNGMGVGIPGTSMIGLPIAAALGAIGGKSSYGLEVLKDIGDEDVVRAKEMVGNGLVQVKLAGTSKLLYVKVTIRKDGHSAWATIEDDHDRFVECGHDGQSTCLTQSAEGNVKEEKSSLDYKLSVKEIYSFTETVGFDDIRFILADRDLNLALAREGLEGGYGLEVGKTIRENQREVFGDDFMSFAMGMTAAASDARMAGCKLPAMSNSGSGNQGITVSMPVIAYAMKYNVDDERLARALIMSNLIAIHIKSYLGKLSALCGCVVASTGSACGIVYLQGGKYEHVCAAIKNMIGNITGMVCDGAKVGCAMKVASGVSSAIQSAVLALNGKCVCETEGIIEKDIEKTIRNLGEIGSLGMKSTDQLIQRIMVCK